jgi:hypothetical protein
MKKLFSILFLFTCVSGFAQVKDQTVSSPVPAAGASRNNQTLHYANAAFDLNLRVPRALGWTLNGAKDSIGYVLFNISLGRFGMYFGNGNWRLISFTGDKISGFDNDAGYLTANTTAFDGRYLQAYNEYDPGWSASPSFGITLQNLTDWNNAVSRANTAFGWGNHASAGYLKSYTETSPLQNVLNRGYLAASNIVLTHTRPLDANSYFADSYVSKVLAADYDLGARGGYGVDVPGRFGSKIYPNSAIEWRFINNLGATYHIWSDYDFSAADVNNWRNLNSGSTIHQNIDGNAATATNAVHANSSDNATNATHANNADNAVNAGYATQSGSIVSQGLLATKNGISLQEAANAGATITQAISTGGLTTGVINSAEVYVNSYPSPSYQSTLGRTMDTGEMGWIRTPGYPYFINGANETRKISPVILPDGSFVWRMGGPSVGLASNDRMILWHDYASGRTYIPGLKTATPVPLEASFAGGSNTIAFAHGQTGVSNNSTAIITPSNAASGNIWYYFLYMTKDATNIYLHFSSYPPADTYQFDSYITP